MNPAAGSIPPGGVLVVDDDEQMCETIVEILAARGIPAEGVGSAAAARAKRDELLPAVALVDHRLPDATGIELGALLKEKDEDLSILLVTGYASLENAIAAVGQFDGFLTKPVPPAELVRAVQASLASSRLRRENRSLLGELKQANLMLEASVADRTKELSSLLRLSEAVAASIELAEVVDACLRTASDGTGARYAGLYLVDRVEEPDLLLCAQVGDPPLPWHLEKHETEPAAEPSEAADERDVVPLKAGGSEVGALVFGEAERRQPMFLATLAASAAVAIQNAQRFGRERETVQRLSELSRMKTTFLAAVSHELRTPMTAVVGFAETLQQRFESLSSEGKVEVVEQIVEQGRRLEGLIEDLLDATRVEFGGLRVRLEPVDVASVFSRIERSFGQTHPLLVQVAADLPPVVADPARLEQVLGNLVANALKHSPADAPVRVEADQDGDQARLRVIDSGSGIEPELLSRLFEPFTQAITETAGRGRGLGLGLYIVRGLVEAMGGTVEAHSRPGEGSEFVVRLQLQPAR